MTVVPSLSALAATAQSTDWQRFADQLRPIETAIAPAQVSKLSKDYYDFSPILAAQLHNKVGDLVVRPKTEAEVLQVAEACVSA